MKTEKIGRSGGHFPTLALCTLHGLYLTLDLVATSFKDFLVFKRTRYPENFFNNCFKVFLDNKYRKQEKVITVPKKTLFLALLYLGPLLLETRTKLRKSLKGILNCCRLQIAFKSQNKLANAFCFKDRITMELTSGLVYKFMCGLCNDFYYAQCIIHLNVRMGEHIRISPLTKKKVEP